jgi:hypothetical protein
MKQVSKLTLLLAFFAISTVSFAQISFGVKAGLNLANLYNDEEDSNPEFIPTFQAGGLVEIGLTNSLAIQTGLSLQGKGAKEEATFLGETIKTSINLLYLQVPAHLLYKGNGFFVGAGPYFGYCLSGKGKVTIGGETDSEDLSIGSSVEDDISGLDFGVGIQAGASFGAIRVGAGYDLGLANLIPKDAQDQTDVSIRNGVINVFAAYMFGGGGGYK